MSLSSSDVILHRPTAVNLFNALEAARQRGVFSAMSLSDNSVVITGMMQLECAIQASVEEEQRPASHQPASDEMVHRGQEALRRAIFGKAVRGVEPPFRLCIGCGREFIPGEINCGCPQQARNPALEAIRETIAHRQPGDDPWASADALSRPGSLQSFLHQLNERVREIEASVQHHAQEAAPVVAGRSGDPVLPAEPAVSGAAINPALETIIQRNPGDDPAMSTDILAALTTQEAANRLDAEIMADARARVAAAPPPPPIIRRTESGKPVNPETPGSRDWA